MNKNAHSQANMQANPTSPQDIADKILQLMRALGMPECTKERYCQGTGVDPGVLQGWINKKLIPTVKRGRHIMINLSAITAQNLQDIAKSQSAQ